VNRLRVREAAFLNLRSIVPFTHGQKQGEDSVVPLKACTAPNRNSPSVLFCNLLCDPQPQPCACRFFRGEERLEQIAQVLTYIGEQWHGWTRPAEARGCHSFSPERGRGGQPPGRWRGGELGRGE